MDHNIRGLPLGAAARLVDHDITVRKRKTLAFRTGCKQESSHAGRHAHADGGHIALDILHRIIDCHTGRNRTAGAVDVEADVLGRILPLKIQKLRNDQTGSCLLYTSSAPPQPARDVYGCRSLYVLLP